MDISDKNSEGFIQFDDPSYIEKLQKIDQSLNKIIDEVLKTQFNVRGDQSNLTNGVNAFITNAIGGEGSGGYSLPSAGVVWGDGLNFDEDTGELTLAGDPPITTNFVLHIGTAFDAYGSNTQNTDSIWSATFGSITPSVIPMGGVDSSYEFTSLATTETQDFVYIAMQGVHYQDFFDGVTFSGLVDINKHTGSADSYFVTDLNGMFQTFWKWSIADIGNWYSTGDRNIGIEFNSIYQQPATTKSFYFGPNSLYAWNSWPDPDTGDMDSYQAKAAQGGKMNVYAAFASSLYPISGFGDPVIYGKHNGICIAYVANGSDVDPWVLLFLNNSDGTENYQLSGAMFSTPLNTVDAIYHTVENDVDWGLKAFGWNVAILGWGDFPYNQFQLTNLD